MLPRSFRRDAPADPPAASVQRVDDLLNDQPALITLASWLPLVAMAVILVGLVGYMSELQRQVRAEAMRGAVAAADLMAENANRLFDTTDFLLEETRLDISGLTWPAIEESRPLWDRLKAREERFEYIDAIWLNDAEGTLRLTTYGWPNPGSNAADRDFFTAHAAPGSPPFISRPMRGRVTGEATFLLSRRLDTPDGDLRGIASVTLRPSYFRDFFASLRKRHLSGFQIIRQADDSVLVGAPGPAVDEPRPADEAVAEAIGGAEPAGTFRTDDRMGAFRRLSPWPATVVVDLDRDSVEAAWMDRMGPYALLAALAALAMGALSAFGFHQTRLMAARGNDVYAALDTHIAALEANNGRLRAKLRDREGEVARLRGERRVRDRG